MSNTPQKIRIGAIGCGGRLRGILTRLLEQDPRLQLVAAHDPFVNAQTAVKKKGENVRLYDDYKQLVKDPDIDWVMIGSPNRFHAEQAVAALDAGKDVFCEKPLATNLEDCLAVRDAIERSGRRFVFGLVLRYSPHYQRMRQLLDEERIGKIISFEFNETLAFDHGGYIFGNWRREGAVAGSHILEKTCHDLDLANWMIGSLPVRIASFGGRRFFTPENEHLLKLGTGKDEFSPFWGDPRGVNPFTGGGDILDHQVVIFEYANGVRATFHTNCATALPERRFYLCGTEGTMRANVYDGSIELKRIGRDEKPKDCSSNASGSHGGGDEIMAANLAATMLENRSPLASVDEGIASALVAFAIDQAAETGQVVDLRPLWERAGVNPDTYKPQRAQAPAAV